jgi:hypothetical protein
MSIVESLNSEPEDLLAKDSAEAENNIEEVKETKPTSFFVSLDDKKIKSKPVIHRPRARIVSNSEIFIVNIDGYPKFYTNTREEAVKKAIRYLKMIEREPDRQYCIDVFENEIQLNSTYNFYIIQYDCLEHLATITSIPQVQFN